MKITFNKLFAAYGVTWPSAVRMAFTRAEAGMMQRRLNQLQEMRLIQLREMQPREFKKPKRIRVRVVPQADGWRYDFNEWGISYDRLRNWFPSGGEVVKEHRHHLGEGRAARIITSVFLPAAGRFPASKQEQDQ